MNQFTILSHMHLFSCFVCIKVSNASSGNISTWRFIHVAFFREKRKDGSKKERGIEREKRDREKKMKERKRRKESRKERSKHICVDKKVCKIWEELKGYKQTYDTQNFKINFIKRSTTLSTRKMQSLKGRGLLSYFYC